MKFIRRKQLVELEDALDHLYEAGQYLTTTDNQEDTKV